MDLRAFTNIIFLYLLLGGCIINISWASTAQPPVVTVPDEIKFANVTFQLNDVTRYLVQNEMKVILSNRQVLANKLEKAALFFPVIEPILKSEEIPGDFRFLASYDKYQSSIEKNGIPESGVFWCFDRQKAEEVDLQVNNQIDERKHLIRASKGAAIYLKRNNFLYKNWGVTLFSMIADKKIINQLEINKNWVSNQSNTGNYILLNSPAYSSLLEFLAYKLVMEQELPAFRPQAAKIVYEYPYGKGKSLNRISAELKIDLSTLSEYNAWLLTKTVPDTYSQVLIVVPDSRFHEIRILSGLVQKSGTSVKELGFPLLAKEGGKPKTRGGVLYRINNLAGIQAEMCDNAITLAYKGDISIRKFAEYNDIKENDLLQIGQVYYLESKNAKANVPFHVVREGETLWSVAHIYGLKLENLLKYNRFETIQRLQRGRVLWLQATRPKNKQVEYINMPDELEAIDELIKKESSNSASPEQPPAEPVKTDTTAFLKKTAPVVIEAGNTEPKETVKNGEKETNLTAKELNSAPLGQEIRKEETKNLNLPKNVDNKDINSTVRNKEETRIKATPPITPQRTDTLEDKTTEQGNFLLHTVRKDDTLFRISVQYNVTLQEIWKLNNLTSNIVKIGKVLKIKRL